MSSVLDDMLNDVRDDILILMDESSDRDVLEAVVREGAPVFLAYKMRGMIPDPRSMQRIATYLLALAAAIEEKRSIRRKNQRNDKGERYGQARA